MMALLAAEELDYVTIKGLLQPRPFCGSDLGQVRFWFEQSGLVLRSKSPLELAKDLHSTVKIPNWAWIRTELPWITFTETIAG